MRQKSLLDIMNRMARRHEALRQRQARRFPGRSLPDSLEMFIAIDPVLASAFQLSKYLLSLRHLGRFAFHFDPAFASSDFHAERFLEILDQFQVVGIKRLLRTRALKLQSARFSHLAAGKSLAAKIPPRVKRCQPLAIPAVMDRRYRSNII